ncbi:MAG: DNA alkylation repair protein, partial [Paludibacteraceae bacterium]|nr:DNA alkylation repair protein [Paludibacteraceae bacterium]
MNWNDVIVLLQANADNDYRDFSIKLSPGVTAMYGVRLPILKQIAKDVCKGDWKSTLMEAKDDSIEELMIQGYIIGFAKSDYNTLIKCVETFVKKIKVWSVCDTTVATFKFVRKEKEKTWDFLDFYVKDADV